MSEPVDSAVRAIVESSRRIHRYRYEDIEAAYQRGVDAERARQKTQRIKWAARLVRLVCCVDLARNVDDDVAEPVRRIALEMRDWQAVSGPSDTPATPQECK